MTKKLNRYLLGNQNADVLVMLAAGLAAMMFLGAIVIDLGGMYVNKAKLQNAADAAALAGAWYLDEDDDKIYDSVRQYVELDMGADASTDAIRRVNANEIPDSTNVINVHMLPSQTELTVYLLMQSPTHFLRYFGINGLPIEVEAKAGVSGGTIITDEMFGFAMCAAHNTKSDYNMENPDSNECSIWFHTDNVDISGNIMTNGKLLFDNATTTTLRGTLYADEDLKSSGKNFSDKYWENGVYTTKMIEPSVWGKYGWGSNGKKETFTFVDEDGNPFVQESEKTYSQEGWQKNATCTEYDRDDKVIFRDEIDISIEKNDSIKQYLQNIKNMSISDRENQHIYYDDNISRNYNFSSSNDTSHFPALCPHGDTIVSNNDTDIPAWNRWYKTVVVGNNIQVSFERSPVPSDDDFAIIVSLNGDIHIPNNVKFNGILYAPNGTIRIDGTAQVSGSIVAQRILLTSSGQNVVANRSMAQSSSSSSLSGKVVKLAK